MQEGKRPVAVGFMFSLGHSTVVVLGSAAIAFTALSLQHRLDVVRHVGGSVSTAVSTLFLFGIAIVNLIVLRSVYLTFQRVRRGEHYVEEDLDLLLCGRGFLSRLFRPMFAMVRRSWHMYPLGILFGLGFDTATEIGLLSISAAEASKKIVIIVDLGFPGAFRRRHVIHRHDRQHSDAGRVWLGLRQADSKALLQHDQHSGFGHGCSSGWRNRSARPIGGPVPWARDILEPGWQTEPELWHPGLLHYWSFCSELDRVCFCLQMASL